MTPADRTEIAYALRAFADCLCAREGSAQHWMYEVGIAVAVAADALEHPPDPQAVYGDPPVRSEWHAGYAGGYTDGKREGADERRLLREANTQLIQERDAALARVAKLREALKRIHCCATLRPDGTCDGCHVSVALAETEKR